MWLGIFKFAIVALQLFKCLWDSGLKNSSILNCKLQNPKRPFIIKETKKGDKNSNVFSFSCCCTIPCTVETL